LSGAGEAQDLPEAVDHAWPALGATQGPRQGQRGRACTMILRLAAARVRVCAQSYREGVKHCPNDVFITARPPTALLGCFPCLPACLPACLPGCLPAYLAGCLGPRPGWLCLLLAAGGAVAVLRGAGGRCLQQHGRCCSGSSPPKQRSCVPCLQAQARSLLEAARLKNPHSAQLWLLDQRRAARTEPPGRAAAAAAAAAAVCSPPTGGDGLVGVQVAQHMLAKALQECPVSCILRAHAIASDARPVRKARSYDALKRKVARLA
jgi:hypothetical protein